MKAEVHMSPATFNRKLNDLEENLVVQKYLGPSNSTYYTLTEHGKRFTGIEKAEPNFSAPRLTVNSDTRNSTLTAQAADYVDQLHILFGDRNRLRLLKRVYDAYSNNHRKPVEMDSFRDIKSDAITTNQVMQDTFSMLSKLGLTTNTDESYVFTPKGIAFMEKVVGSSKKILNENYQSEYKEFSADMWQVEYWSILIETRKEGKVIMTTIGASAMDNNANKKFGNAIFERFKEREIQTQLIGARGYMPPKRVSELRRYGIQVRFVDLEILSNPPAFLRPTYPRLTDLSHVTVSDRRNWLYTETAGKKNNLRGFRCINDPLGAGHLSDILEAIWSFASD